MSILGWLAFFFLIMGHSGLAVFFFFLWLMTDD